jgi:predicted transcriptional regulator of viral defense system
MKYYQQLVDQGCFTRQDAEILVGNEKAAHSMLYDYMRKGMINRVKRDLYVAMSYETRQPVVNRYVIASHLSSDAYITHHSAFEYYGLANQVFHEVYVAAASKFTPFTFNGIAYRYVSPRIGTGVDSKLDGVRVTDMERTVIDSINDVEKIGGLEEFLRCIDLIPFLKSDKLLVYLAHYQKGFLYQKAGYILENYQKPLKLSKEFFEECRKLIPKSSRYFSLTKQRKEQSVFNDKWRIYVPTDLNRIVDEGGDEIV